MIRKNGQFDDNLDFQLSDEFKKDLGNLFKPGDSVPPEIDRAILDRASNRIVSRQRRYRIIRRIGTVAATAAVIILAFSLDLSKKPETQSPATSLAQAVSFDIDQSGRVDILDAFKLARHLESSRTGIERELDMNNDGIVDRKDVDTVALAAVALDKGVL